jgi:hypothetical protein
MAYLNQPWFNREIVNRIATATGVEAGEFAQHGQHGLLANYEPRPSSVAERGHRDGLESPVK